MSRDSNSHFEGAIILDDDGDSSDNTGPIAYFGFGKGPSGGPDESIGPRVLAQRTFVDPAFTAPQGSLFLPRAQFVWHNIDGTPAGWVRIIQEGTFPAIPADPAPAYQGVISIDLPDSGAVTTQITEFPFTIPGGANNFPVVIDQVTRVTYYKLEAAGTANVTVQPSFVSFGGATVEPFHSAPVVLNVGHAGGFMDVVKPTNLFQSLQATPLSPLNSVLRVEQVKSLAGENNAVRVVIEVIATTA
jgi:hypothetical protein